METTTCTVCCKNKTALSCTICKRQSCKNCSYFFDEDQFEVPSSVSQELQDGVYCPSCYDESIYEKIQAYEETLQKAKDVDVYTKQQSTETRLIRRIEKPIQIKDCEDREETLMRLAFAAAERGFHTIVDVNLVSKKMGVGSYKKLVWNGYAVPVDPEIRKK